MGVVVRDGMLGATEVRQALGISEATYFRWLAAGRLPGVKVGRRWRFDPRAIERLVQPEAVEAEAVAVRTALEHWRGNTAALGEQEGVVVVAQILEGEPTEVARLMVEHAVAREASDVHLDPLEDGLAVRERIDGTLQTVEPALPGPARRPLVRAFKELAGLDPAVESQPQVGHVVTRVGDRRVDLRVSTFPTALGEALSIRLPPMTKLHGMDDLGYSGAAMAMVRAALGSRPFGLVISAGPTGSGKSTAMYALARELMTPGRRVVTIEDGVALHIEGALQSTTSPDFTRAEALRALYDVDVDVAVVSDLETRDEVRLACDLAQTGRHVVSVLHARDAAAAVHRLLRLGELEPDALAEALTLVAAQRLIPRSCPDCRSTRRPTGEEADRLGLTGAARRRGLPVNAGCDACAGSGARGRLVLTEIVTMTDGLATALAMPDASVDSLRAAMSSGRIPMEDDLRRALAEGVVCIDAATSAMV